MQISYPKTDFKLKSVGDAQKIWDIVRKRWVCLTPEEWVRQNFVQYLLNIKNYPPSLLAVEKGIVVNGLKKRCDIVVFKNSDPWLIVECKEPNVPLSEDTFMQVVRYNMTLQVPYLVLTNGAHTLGWHVANNKIEPLLELPTW
ncbi:MAG: restriction endonuclease subunit R [Pseudopedobacter saltans]|uniref:Restriction endonuclease subunit R n=1 Tax=Pseudopedobacter saltans TaxID=151895 RepID=A0A2W5EKC0_9SPHI|nr:MAG: restriction endonuclease subunit R [Pseudopedobacter saltans]